tara:strand:+ start:978 stop:1334 length:357 start_codon:yes stop_codon:yes gene_type:complete
MSELDEGSNGSGWQLNKQVNVAEILAIVTFAGVAMVSFFDMGKRVTKNELVNIQQDISISDNKNNIKELISAIENQRLESKDDLSRLSADIHQTNITQNAKIDRIYEHVVKSNSRSGS